MDLFDYQPSQDTAPSLDLSIVVPLYNEEESLPELQAWIQRVMQQHGFTTALPTVPLI